MRIKCPNCHHGLEIVPDTPSAFITCPSCGSQLDPNSGETITYRPDTRRTVGRFELLEHVGRGHFGNVWRARDTQLQRIVAVKIPRTADLTETDRVLFLREAQTAAKLRHPNIVTVHEVGYEGDALFIVSDFIEGVTLSEQLKIRQPSCKEAAEWCAAVGDALDYAHEQGVIHRDMKPGNVMLEGEGKPYVLDFGLAKHEASDFTITAAGEILGTPAYMSPEQARGDAAAADRRSDVYSLGVVLYELLTGERPFKGGTRSLVHQILNEEPKSPRRIKREIPRDLETICLRAIAKEPGRRYVTAKELAADLRRYLAGEPIRARPVRWPERAWRWSRRNPALSIASGIAAVALLLLMLQFGQWLVAASESAAGAKKVRLEIWRKEQADPHSGKSPAANAEVVFWRLDPATGDPLLTERVRASGKSPISARLRPGDYLVVAVIEHHGFHEVYRHVPGENAGPQAYLHQKSSVDASGVVTLPDVNVLPLAEVESGMARFAGKRFTLGSEQLNSAFAHEVEVAPFLLDPKEVTVEELERRITLPQEMQKLQKPAGHAVHSLSWSMAMDYAETIGKRLMEEREYEAAATSYGQTRFPWGDEPRITKWEIGAVGTPIFDRTPTTPAVEGLYSNVGEWTVNWAAPYPRERALGIVYPHAGMERIIRGAPAAVIEGKPIADDALLDPRERIVYPQAVALPGLGFRCARSAQPRLKPEDFSRVVTEKK